jgi:hypothetical protein
MFNVMILYVNFAVESLDRHGIRHNNIYYACNFPICHHPPSTMMIRETAAKIIGLLFVVLAGSVLLLRYHPTALLASNSVGCFKCPNSSNDYTPECLEFALPPWPICWFHSVDYFVSKSIDGASRCCGDDSSACMCPKKDTPEFQDQIGNWCKGIREHCVPCSVDGDEALAHQEEEEEEGRDKEEPTSGDKVMEESTRTEIKMEGEEILPEDHVPLAVARNVGRRRAVQGNDDRCPTDDTYAQKCLESAMPPYPICTKQTVDEWVDKALVGYDRCCGEQMGRCKCPRKDTPRFASKIGDWCAGVETCSSPSSTFATTASSTGMTTATATTTTTTNLLRASKERLEVAASGDEN